MYKFFNEITILEIIIRIFIAILIGGMIGYERGCNNRPAGFRTHILVCLGATIVSLLQDILRVNLITFVMANPETNKVMSSDISRLGAQVISGIGFLGAGSIMRDKGVIEGLTTAASIWATGCIGLAIGWGFYNLAIPSGVAILVILAILKRVERYLIDNKHIIKIIIKFKNEKTYACKTLEVYQILTLMNIKIKKLKKDIGNNTVFYTVVASKDINVFDIMSELSKCECVSEIKIP